MSKFHPRKSGNKYQYEKGKITSYMAILAPSLLHKAGFILDDGTILEFTATTDGARIILQKEAKE